MALLLFSLGLELSFRELKPVRAVALGGATIQIVLTIALGAALGLGLGWEWRVALWFGSLVSLSSTMVALKTIQAQGRLGTLSSRVMLGILVVQDLAVVPLMIVLPELSDPGGGFSKVVIAARARDAAARRHRVVLDPSRASVDGMGRALEFTRTVLSVDDHAGVWRRVRRVRLWPVDGARRICRRTGRQRVGIRAPGAERRHSSARSVRYVVLRVGRDAARPGARWASNWACSRSSSSVIVVGKAAILAGVVRAFGYWNIVPLAVGLTLFQVGEFAFVLARVGLSSGAIPTDVYSLTLNTAIVTMSLTPALSALVPVLYDRLWPRRARETFEANNLPSSGLSGHVIVAGIGPRRQEHRRCPVASHAAVCADRVRRPPGAAGTRRRSADNLR